MNRTEEYTESYVYFGILENTSQNSKERKTYKNEIKYNERIEYKS